MSVIEDGLERNAHKHTKNKHSKPLFHIDSSMLLLLKCQSKWFIKFRFLCGFISLSEKSNKKLYGKKICCKTFSLRRNLEYENIYNFILMLLRMLLAFRSKDEIERDRSRKIHQIVLLSFDMKRHAGKTTWITISNHHFIWFSLFQF